MTIEPNILPGTKTSNMKFVGLPKTVTTDLRDKEAEPNGIKGKKKNSFVGDQSELVLVKVPGFPHLSCEVGSFRLKVHRRHKNFTDREARPRFKIPKRERLTFSVNEEGPKVLSLGASQYPFAG